jgi:hypothetical protein
MNIVKLLSIIVLSSSLNAIDHPSIKPWRFLAGREILSQQGTWQIQPKLQLIKGKRVEDLQLTTDIDYGLTRLLGIEFVIPFFLKRKNAVSTSGGLGDISVRLEYKVYWKETEMIALSAGLHLPTGSRKKYPITGSGTIDFLWEYRALHSSEKWYGQSIIKGLLRTTRNHQRIGHTVTFDINAGPQISMPDRGESKLLATLELQGEYVGHFKLFRNNLNRRGGGFIVFLGPTFVWAKGNFLLEGLFHLPICQRYPFENKRNDFVDFRVAGSVIISF